MSRRQMPSSSQFTAEYHLQLFAFEDYKEYDQLLSTFTIHGSIG